jgi:hypothetical protein
VFPCFVGETNELLRERFQMTFRHYLLSGALIAVAACGPQRQPQEPSKNMNAPLVPAPSAPPAVQNSAPAAEATETEKRTSLPEPKGPIDPKSAEAAGQVVQHYGALIEQGRWTESWKLWSNAESAKQFDRNWRNDSEVHMEIGKPGETEGAAGSIYTTMPVVFYGKTKAGGSFRRSADVILRRVNDVPGSTEAQRRWHIERIEWK